MHLWRRFLHHTNAIYAEKFRFLHICQVETSEISPHVKKFSITPQLSYMKSGKRNIRSVPYKSIIMLLLMYKIETMKSKYLLKYWPSRPLGITYCIVLEPERTLRVNIFCKPWFSQEMITFKTPSYENKKNCKYNLNLRQR